MTTSRDPIENRRRAEFYKARAQNYRCQAGRLLEEGDADSASALLYEAAKQCINAVANLRGENPGGTRAKMRALRAISDLEPGDLTILRNWEDALRLHIHADRGHLAYSELDEAWSRAQAFVDAMLDIYEREWRR